jgi:hypothetical protein
MTYFVLRHPALEVGMPEPQFPQPSTDPENPTEQFKLVVIHRSSDPDSSYKDGYDYIVADGEQTPINEWAVTQNVEILVSSNTPQQIKSILSKYVATHSAN